jgi:hypothetical protein
MTTFMEPPPAATFLAFYPIDNNIIAIGTVDSSIQIYNVRTDEVSIKCEFIIPCFRESQSIGKLIIYGSHWKCSSLPIVK